MSRRSPFARTKPARALLLMGAALLFVFFQPEGFSRTLRGVAHTLAWPFEKVFSSVAWRISDTGEFLSSIGTLKQDNERLRSENIRLKAENAHLTSLRGENEMLRTSVGLKIRERFDLLSAEVIGSGGEGQGGVILIDQGSMSGVRSGMYAVVGDGVFVGVVDEVFPFNAKVSVLTNSKSAFGGVTIENGTKGIVGGNRGLGMFFDLVLGKDALHEGDRIVTSGVGGTVPRGLLIGTVENVHESGDRLFQQASIISPVDLNGLRFVFLIKEDRHP
jgi:rod shape-determining protein MreC